MDFADRSKIEKPASKKRPNPALEHIPLSTSSDVSSTPGLFSDSPSKSNKKLVVWLVMLSAAWVILLLAGIVLLMHSRQENQKLKNAPSSVFERPAITSASLV